MSTTYNIVAFVLTNDNLTLYTKSGDKLILKQGDARIKDIIEQIHEPLNTTGECELVLLPTHNIYSSFAELTKNEVNFVITDTNSSIEHIIDYNSTKVSAIINDDVLPGVEKLIKQFNNAVKLGNEEGVVNFLKRAIAVNKQRNHSVEDLLKFMEQGDLPIANDGSIIIYKILRRYNNTPNLYVDCHTRKVIQRVGSYVCMAHNLVDHDRRNECSNGLHVARRGYISRFSGDVCVAAKVAPEDVIAVPDYNANKMRVCGYHILKELPDEAYRSLINDRPITETDTGKNILANIVNGNHIGKLEEVRITKNYGAGLVTTPLVSQEEFQEQLNIYMDAIDLTNPVSEQAEKVLPKDVIKKKKENEMTRQETITNLYDALPNVTRKTKIKYLRQIHTEKQTSKQSYEYFGLDSDYMYGLLRDYGIV